MKNYYSILTMILLLVSVLKAEDNNKYLNVLPKAEFQYFVDSSEKRIYVSDELKDGKMRYDIGKMKVKLGIEFSMFNNRLSVYFDNSTYINPATRSFAPTHTDFYSGISFKISDKIKIGFEHLCSHPILSGGIKQPMQLYGGYNSVKISYGY